MGICVTKPIGDNMSQGRDKGYPMSAPTTSRTREINKALVDYMNSLPRLFFNIQVEGQDYRTEEGSKCGRRFICSMNVGRSHSHHGGSGGGRIMSSHSRSRRNLIFRAMCPNERSFFEKSLDYTDLENIKRAIDSEGNISWSRFFKALDEASNSGNMRFEFIPADERRSSTADGSSGETTTTAAATTKGSKKGDRIRMRLDLDFEQYGVHTLNITMRRSTSGHEDKEIADYFILPLYDFYSMHAEGKKPDPKVTQLEKELQTLKERAYYLQFGKSAKSARSPLQKSEPEHSKSIVFKGEEVDLINFKSSNVLEFLKEIKKRMVQMGALSDVDQESFNQVLNTISFDALFSARLNEVSIRKELQTADEQILKWLKRKFAVKDEDSRDITSVDNTTERDASSEVFKERLDTTESGNTDEKTRRSILEMFDRLDEWNFDVFTLDKLTEGHTLFITGYTLFLRYDLINKFNIDEKVLINFLQEVEAGYHPNPYHNAMHAADVTQVMHYIITKGGLMRFMTDEDVFAAIFACLVHDLDHPGLNNAYQIASESYLATLYNDQSVLENHHCSQAFELCRDPKYNIFKNVSYEQYRDIRATVIDLVLATDMSLHGAVFGKFKSRIDAGSDFTSKEDVRLALQIAIKMADVSNPTRPRDLYLAWTERITDEFYKQGDKERENSMPVSPMMDRYKGAVGKGQIAFMNYIIQPMFEAFCKLLPTMNHTVDIMAENRQYWMDQD